MAKEASHSIWILAFLPLPSPLFLPMSPLLPSPDCSVPYHQPGNSQLSLGSSVLAMDQLWDAVVLEPRPQRLVGPQSGFWAQLCPPPWPYFQSHTWLQEKDKALSILWGLSLLLHQRAQAQGCLVKRKGGRKEKRKEREGRKERGTFWKEARGSRLFREKRCWQGMEAPRNPGLLREGDNKQKQSVSFKSRLALFRGTDGELSPWPLAPCCSARQQHRMGTCEKRGILGPTPDMVGIRIFLLTRTCGDSRAHSSEKRCPGGLLPGPGVSGLGARGPSQSCGGSRGDVSPCS